MGADPFQSVGVSNSRIGSSGMFFVIEGHACDSIYSREGICHCWERLTQRSRSESKVVSVGTGTSLKQPRLEVRAAGQLA